VLGVPLLVALAVKLPELCWTGGTLPLALVALALTLSLSVFVTSGAKDILFSDGVSLPLTSTVALSVEWPLALTAANALSVELPFARALSLELALPFALVLPLELALSLALAPPFDWALLLELALPLALALSVVLTLALDPLSLTGGIVDLDGALVGVGAGLPPLPFVLPLFPSPPPEPPICWSLEWLASS
jgi:hypothetical protein